MDLHLYIGGILNGRVYNWLKSLRKGVNSLPLYESGFGFKPLIAEFDRKMADYGGKIFVSEMGCGGFTDLDKTMKGFGDQMDLVDAQEIEIIRQDLHSGFKKRNLKRIFGSINNLIKTAIRQQTLAIRSQVEAIISNPNISGYSLTQLEDVSWEFQAGILDLWQNPKPSYFELIRLNKDTVVIIHPLSHITTPYKPIILETSILHRTDPIEDVDIQLFIIPPDGVKYIQTHQKISLTEGINNLDDEQFLSGDLTGNYVIHMKAIANDMLLAESTTEILVVSDYQEIQTSAEIEWLGKIPDLPIGMSAPSSSANKFFIAAFPSTLSENQLRTRIEMIANGGGTLSVGPLSPSDRMVIDIFNEFGIELRLKFGIGNWMGCHHWLPPELINETLFTNPIADEKFIGITPRYSFLENNGNVIAGSFQNGKSHREPIGMVWYSDIEKVSLGKGSVVFCQYRIFNQLKSHPLASRILDGILAKSL
jgi:hypothetical protein